VVSKSSSLFFKKLFHLNDDKTDFLLFTSNEFVSAYFKNPYREAYMNDRIIDER